MKKIRIEPLNQNQIIDAAELFLAGYRELKTSVPSLPDGEEIKEQLIPKLVKMTAVKRGIAAMRQGRLIGYLGWVYGENFRKTGRRVAYCPEWAHAASGEAAQETCLALYREAARLWSAAGCKSHAFTYLVNNKPIDDFLYWNGFGLTCVDAIRSMQPIENTRQSKGEIRKANKTDAGVITQLSQEMWDHLAQAPISMVPNRPDKVKDIEAFLDRPQNSYWLAEVDGKTAAYFRVEGDQAGNTFLVQSVATVAITGAYTRPQYRGLGLATDLLNAVLHDYAGKGFERCSVDYESINPEASAYWKKHFTPVCYSAFRHPERSLKSD